MLPQPGVHAPPPRASCEQQPRRTDSARHLRHLRQLCAAGRLRARPERAKAASAAPRVTSSASAATTPRPSCAQRRCAARQPPTSAPTAPTARGQGECGTRPTSMLESESKHALGDLTGLMHFHLPHVRSIVSPLIDLPGSPPRLAGFYSTPPNRHNSDITSAWRHNAPPAAAPPSPARSPRASPAIVRACGCAGGGRDATGTAGNGRSAAADGARASPLRPGGGGGGQRPDERVQQQHRVGVVGAHPIPAARPAGAATSANTSSIAQPLFSRSPGADSVTRVRTSPTAMLRSGDAVVAAIEADRALLRLPRGARSSLCSVVRYEQGKSTKDTTTSSTCATSTTSRAPGRARPSSSTSCACPAAWGTPRLRGEPSSPGAAAQLEAIAFNAASTMARRTVAARRRPPARQPSRSSAPSTDGAGRGARAGDPPR